MTRPGFGVVLLRAGLGFEHYFVYSFGFFDAQSGQNALLSWGELSALGNPPVGRLDLNNAYSVELSSDPGPCVSDPGLGYSHEQERQVKSELCCKHGSRRMKILPVHRPVGVTQSSCGSSFWVRRSMLHVLARSPRPLGYCTPARPCGK